MLMALSTVAIFREPYQAYLAKARLEAEDIEAFVVDEYYVGVNWLVSNAIGGVKLQVDERDFTSADEVLHEELPELLIDEPNGPGCPECGSSDLSANSNDRRVRAISLWIGFPLALGQYRYRCEQCGHGFRKAPSHRGFAARVADLLSLVLLAAYFAATLPFRLVQLLLAHLNPKHLECWSCSTAYPVGAASCPNCKIRLPPPQAYKSVVELGKDYDSACETCNTPFASTDYTATTGLRRCSYCRAGV